MADSIPFPAPMQTRMAGQTSAELSSIPWYIWCAVAGVVSAMIGGYWDISWHMSIGRDSFWTPAHIAIYMNGVLVGIACGYLILSTTFGRGFAARSAAVKIWGFQGPLGAFIASWGCFAMLTSAPFDNWWHNAYGLDVKILSPPHVLLFVGGLGIKVGILALIAGLMNRAPEELHRKLTWLFLFVGALSVSQANNLLTELTWTDLLHSASAYRAICTIVPIALIGVGWGSARPWAFTIIAAIYTALMLAFEWILPLVPAQPKLGPVYQHVTHLVPLRFPLLLIVPAVVLDLLWRKIGPWNRWAQAAVAGPAFLVSLIAVEWPFASFLMTPAARNWFFGMNYFAYFDPANFLYNPYKFSPTEKTRAEFWIGLAIALVVSIITSRIGLAWGDWMRRIRR
jgi:hypothetical protein